MNANGKLQDEQIPTVTVEAIGQINFQGNIIPHSWYEHVKLKSGKPDVIAIILLAEFVYWYRPSEIVDEDTKRVTGLKKKFKADKLQYSYKQMTDKFGITKNQAIRACANLKRLGLITLELRTIKPEFSNPISNVMFVEVKPDKIMEVTHGKNTTNAIAIQFKVNSPPIQNGEVSNLNAIPTQSKLGTYTKITPQTTTKTTTKTTTEREPALTLAGLLSSRIIIKEPLQEEIATIPMPPTRLLGMNATIKDFNDEIKKFKNTARELDLHQALKLVNEFGIEEFFDALEDLDDNIEADPENPRWGRGINKVLLSYILQQKKLQRAVA